MTSLATLMAEAKRLKIQVNLAHLTDDMLGCYVEAERAIYVRLGLPMSQTKQVLAHELAHAFYAHTCSSGPNERVADKRAALLLVDQGSYARAERIDPEPSAIADELGLTRKVVLDYQRYWLDGREQQTSAASRR